MMGYRMKFVSGDEYDAIPKWSRRFYQPSRKVLAKIKRQMKKRLRKLHKQELKKEVIEYDS